MSEDPVARPQQQRERGYHRLGAVKGLCAAWMASERRGVRMGEPRAREKPWSFPSGLLPPHPHPSPGSSRPQAGGSMMAPAQSTHVDLLYCPSTVTWGQARSPSYTEPEARIGHAALTPCRSACCRTMR
jgi:hypothetical protein